MNQTIFYLQLNDLKNNAVCFYETYAGTIMQLTYFQQVYATAAREQRVSM